MRIPLDQLCVKSGVLCPRCESLVRSGAVTELDVEVMRVLLKAESAPDFRFLRDSEYVRSVKLSNIVVVQLDSPNADSKSLLKLIKYLESELGSRVRIVNSKTASTKELVRSIIQPARVLGVNTLWLPDGTMEYVVRIPKSDLRYLPAPQEEVENLLSTMVGTNVRIRVT
ncbi:MAG: transcription elongation factor [Desulfurococcaceae archaeon]|nr:transcription elongation factor [Desulfurococcaceae archaeon]